MPFNELYLLDGLCVVRVPFIRHHKHGLCVCVCVWLPGKPFRGVLKVTVSTGSVGVWITEGLQGVRCVDGSPTRQFM